MAGLFGFNNYGREGKGVPKDAPTKRSLFLFFELFFRKFSKFIWLNLLYLVLSIPTMLVVLYISGFFSSTVLEYLSPLIIQIFNLSHDITIASNDVLQLTLYIDLILRALATILFTVLLGMGPVTCGFTYVLRNYARQEHSWLFSDFFLNTKNNFKQGLLVWIIDIFVVCILYIAYRFYALQTGFLYIMKYFIVTIALVYAIMHFYIYQIMITFELSIKQIYKNSLILALGRLPRNLLILVSLIFICLAIPYYSIFSSSFAICILIYIAIVLLILFSLSGFLINFFVYPIIKKEMLSKVDPEKYSDN